MTTNISHKGRLYPIKNAHRWLIVEVRAAVQEQCCVLLLAAAMQVLSGRVSALYSGNHLIIFALKALWLTIEASLTILTPFASVVTSVGGGSFGACSPSTA
jgi:hypothetical protein